MWVTQSNWKLQTIMTCANTLPGTERKFIPLKLLQSDLDPFLLHIVMIILWCHSSRITSFFQTQAKMWCNALGASLPPRCKIYYMTGTRQISYQRPSDSFSQSVSQLTSQHTKPWFSPTQSVDGLSFVSGILYKRATVIRRVLVSARRPARTILFHGQEQNLAIEPSLWPAKL